MTQPGEGRQLWQWVKSQSLDVAGTMSGPRLTSDWLCDLEQVVFPPRLNALLGKFIHSWDLSVTEHLLSAR